MRGRHHPNAGPARIAGQGIRPPRRGGGGLKANGVSHLVEGDDLIVHGDGSAPAGGGTVETHLDHRIAMAFLVLGMAAHRPVTVDDGAMIATSYPAFLSDMRALGAAFPA